MSNDALLRAERIGAVIGMEARALKNLGQGDQLALWAPDRESGNGSVGLSPRCRSDANRLLLLRSQLLPRSAMGPRAGGAGGVPAPDLGLYPALGLRAAERR